MLSDLVNHHLGQFYCCCFNVIYGYILDMYWLLKESKFTQIS